MKVTSKVNKSNLKLLEIMMQNNLVKAADSLMTNVQEAQIMPFDTGYMQNDSMYLDECSKKRGFVLIKVDTPYARKMYFHPEYNFQTDNNHFAGGLWFEPWITGIKKAYFPMAFAKLLRKDLQKYDTKRD